MFKFEVVFNECKSKLFVFKVANNCEWYLFWFKRAFGFCDVVVYCANGVIIDLKYQKYEYKFFINFKF